MTDNPGAESGAKPSGFWSIWPFRLVLLFFATVATYGFAQAAPVIFKSQLKAFPRDAILLVAAACGIAASIAAYRLLVRWTEKRWPAELGTAKAAPHFAIGALIGLGLFTTVYAILFALHVATFKGFGTTQDLAAAFALSILSGVCEEILFRGVVFRILEGAMGTLVALLISGALFGLIHAGNPGATTVSTVAIALEAGILLAAAYTLTRSLWLAIGLHFAWNFAEGGIYSAPVSGIPFKGLLNAPIAGPQLLSGGSFGPEASLVAIGVCLTAALVMLVMTVRRGEWKPLTFRLRTAG